MATPPPPNILCGGADNFQPPKIIELFKIAEKYLEENKQASPIVKIGMNRDDGPIFGYSELLIVGGGVPILNVLIAQYSVMFCNVFNNLETQTESTSLIIDH